MQHAGVQYGPGTAPTLHSTHYTPPENSPSVPNGNSTTSVLRSWRKKDAIAEKLPPAEPPLVENQGPVARVAPHAHYPKQPVSDAYRFSQSFGDYSLPQAPQAPVPVKYSEIIEPVDHISPLVMAKPKEKYLEMCHIQQPHAINSTSYKPYSETMKNYANMQQYKEQYYMQKESQVTSNYGQKDSNFSPYLPNYKMQNQYTRSYRETSNDFLTSLNKIAPQMAQDIINDPHLRDSSQFPVYHSLEQNRLYQQQQQRIYQPIHPTPSYAQRTLPQNYNQYGMNHQRISTDTYRLHQYQNNLVARYPHEQMASNNISPRHQYPSEMNFPPVPHHRISPTYPPCSQLEYSQHYQHRQVRQDYVPVSGKTTYPPEIPEIVPEESVQQPSPTKSLKRFLETWSEDHIVEETETSAQSDRPMQIIKTPTATRPGENTLYVLDAMEISSENIPQYLHLQPIDKLPPNIRGFYTNNSAENKINCAVANKTNKQTVRENTPKNEETNGEEEIESVIKSLPDLSYHALALDNPTTEPEKSSSEQKKNEDSTPEKIVQFNVKTETDVEQQQTQEGKGESKILEKEDEEGSNDEEGPTSSHYSDYSDDDISKSPIATSFISCGESVIKPNIKMAAEEEEEEEEEQCALNLSKRQNQVDNNNEKRFVDKHDEDGCEMKKRGVIIERRKYDFEIQNCDVCSAQNQTGCDDIRSGINEESPVKLADDNQATEQQKTNEQKQANEEGYSTKEYVSSPKSSSVEKGEKQKEDYRDDNLEALEDKTDREESCTAISSMTDEESAQSSDASNSASPGKEETDCEIEEINENETSTIAEKEEDEEDTDQSSRVAADIADLGHVEECHLQDLPREEDVVEETKPLEENEASFKDDIDECAAEDQAPSIPSVEISSAPEDCFVLEIAKELLQFSISEVYGKKIIAITPLTTVKIVVNENQTTSSNDDEEELDELEVSSSDSINVSSLMSEESMKQFEIPANQKQEIEETKYVDDTRGEEEFIEQGMETIEEIVEEGGEIIEEEEIIEKVDENIENEKIVEENEGVMREEAVTGQEEMKIVENDEEKNKNALFSEDVSLCECGENKNEESQRETSEEILKKTNAISGEEEYEVDAEVIDEASEQTEEEDELRKSRKEENHRRIEEATILWEGSLECHVCEDLDNAQAISVENINIQQDPIDEYIVTSQLFEETKITITNRGTIFMVKGTIGETNEDPDDRGRCQVTTPNIQIGEKIIKMPVEPEEDMNDMPKLLPYEMDASNCVEYEMPDSLGNPEVIIDHHVSETVEVSSLEVSSTTNEITETRNSPEGGTKFKRIRSPSVIALRHYRKKAKAKKEEILKKKQMNHVQVKCTVKLEEIKILKQTPKSVLNIGSNEAKKKKKKVSFKLDENDKPLGEGPEKKRPPTPIGNVDKEEGQSDIVAKEKKADDENLKEKPTAKTNSYTSSNVARSLWKNAAKNEKLFTIEKSPCEEANNTSNKRRLSLEEYIKRKKRFTSHTTDLIEKFPQVKDDLSALQREPNKSEDIPKKSFHLDKSAIEEKLNSLELFLPKVNKLSQQKATGQEEVSKKLEELLAQKPISFESRASESVLIRRFLNRECLKPEEVKKIRQIVQYKRALEELKARRPDGRRRYSYDFSKNVNIDFRDFEIRPNLDTPKSLNIEETNRELHESILSLGDVKCLDEVSSSQPNSEPGQPKTGEEAAANDSREVADKKPSTLNMTTQSKIDLVQPKDLAQHKNDPAQCKNDLAISKNDMALPKNDAAQNKNNSTPPKNYLAQLKNEPAQPSNNLVQPKNNSAPPKNNLAQLKTEPAQPTNNLTLPKNEPELPKNCQRQPKNEPVQFKNDVTQLKNDLAQSKNDLVQSKNYPQPKPGDAKTKKSVTALLKPVPTRLKETAYDLPPKPKSDEAKRSNNNVVVKPKLAGGNHSGDGKSQVIHALESLATKPKSCSGTHKSSKPDEKTQPKTEKVPTNSESVSKSDLRVDKTALSPPPPPPIPPFTNRNFLISPQDLKTRLNVLLNLYKKQLQTSNENNTTIDVENLRKIEEIIQKLAMPNRNVYEVRKPEPEDPNKNIKIHLKKVAGDGQQKRRKRFRNLYTGEDSEDEPAAAKELKLTEDTPPMTDGAAIDYSVYQRNTQAGVPKLVIKRRKSEFKVDLQPFVKLIRMPKLDSLAKKRRKTIKLLVR